MEKIDLAPYKTSTVPYTWIEQERLLGIMKRIDETDIPEVMIDNLYKAFVYSPEKDRDPTPSKDSGKEKLNTNYAMPRLIKIQGRNNNVVSCVATAFSAFRCHAIGRKCPNQNLISVNPPLFIQNLLLKPLEIYVI